ncbi:methyl-accepting chemotaxis protein [Rahnella selenatireducens]|uniref:methyl-accepting chemotaxis protein n=1 Tax=Rahnella selenatireducens TaxID=3389797 RepID=UPI003967F55F
MRVNMPVTQHEYGLDPDTTLMSTTDINSRIIYANSAFINVSGFSEDELIFKPHNIVRHPDMPVEAFADMWFTLQQGDSWTGLVKNRRKNGDHYWVRANVTPVHHQDKLTGYISVRNKPAEHEIKAAEELYKLVKDKNAGSRKFYKGLVVRTGLFSLFSVLQKLPVSWRLRLPLFIAGIFPLLFPLTGMAQSWVAISTIILLLLADLFLQTQIRNPIKTILGQAQQVVSGKKADSVHFNRVDEIGLLMRSVNQFGLNLHSLVEDVGTQVGGISNISNLMSKNSTALSARTEETAANLQQTAAAIEEIAGAVGQSADTVIQASKLADSAASVAKKGGEIMQDTIGMMQSISQASSKVVDIISVIDGIAFQTNILALNAAVEAARAGTEGRGFAVVAAEVRVLAQRSATAAKEIKALIEANMHSVETGGHMVESAGKQISEIIGEVVQMSGLIKEISHATSEQTSALSLINTSLAQIETMTQDNAGMVAQSSESAETLNYQATRLKSAIDVYGGQMTKMESRSALLTGFGKVTVS